MSRSRVLWLGLALVAGAALALLLRERPEAEPAPTPSRVAARPAAAVAVSATPAVGSAAPEPPPDTPDEVAAEPSAAVELPWELEEIAHRYRGAESVEVRTDALLELGLSDDPSALAFLLDELEHAEPSHRESILSGVIQFGSRDAVPKLRALAHTARDPEQRRALQEAADYLALPSLSELRRGEIDLGP